VGSSRSCSPCNPYVLYVLFLLKLLLAPRTPTATAPPTANPNPNPHPHPHPNPNQDTDGDGTADCLDQCPYDPNAHEAKDCPVQLDVEEDPIEVCEEVSIQVRKRVARA
jgi:hypothetical protein